MVRTDPVGRHRTGGSFMALKYKRILLKLSGEALAGEKKVGLDFDVIKPIAAS